MNVNALRLGGIASGLDTDQIVRDLMSIERMKADKLFQNRQIMQWEKEQFREITNKVRSFRDTYFNILKPETNLLSLSSMKKMQASSGNTDIVKVIANADAAVGRSTFRVIESALQARAEGSAVSFGSDAGNRLNLTDTLETLSGKLASGDLEFDENGSFALTINDEIVVINKKDTLRDVLNRINNSKAGVQATYSNFSDTFSVVARETGDGHISTDNGGNFFSAFGIGFDPETGLVGEAGRDARFEINGFEGSRAGNSFTIEGITYSIVKQIEASEGSPVVEIVASIDGDGIYGVIEQFVKDYNELIGEINGKLKEEQFRDFLPLTDEQKEEMKEKDIERWEEKAQSGLLRREPLLENLLREMRRALTDAVGVQYLSGIGIMTSGNYRDNGKLVLKEGGNTLKAAIAENPDKVINLFAGSSSISYSPNLTAGERTQRYAEVGLAQRLSDIFNDNIRTTRDNNGQKGVLLERAGIEGDLTEYNNFYDRKILAVNKSIDRLNEILWRKEEQLYRQFSVLEKSLQQLYSQSDWLTAQMNSLLSFR